MSDASEYPWSKIADAHVEILESIRAKDAVRAEEAMRVHLAAAIPIPGLPL
jgi:DNA-binding GntR family transcriptional regulator